MFVVVGQEIYDDSPFTKKIHKIMGEDVSRYYVLILIIFLIGNGCLFCILWNWLRIRVTDRIKQLKKKIQSGDQNDKNKYNYSSLRSSSNSSGIDGLLRRNSMDLRSALTQQLDLKNEDETT